MISPHTPPGTIVVAIVDVPALLGLPGVHKGRYYTVARMLPLSKEWAQKTGRGACVELEGHGVGESYEPEPGFWRSFFFWRQRHWAYPITAFRHLDLGPLEKLLDIKVKAS
jgi:hypothetical protein